MIALSHAIGSKPRNDSELRLPVILAAHLAASSDDDRAATRASAPTLSPIYRVKWPGALLWLRRAREQMVMSSIEFSQFADPADYAGALAILVNRDAGRGVMFAPAQRARAADVTAMAIHARGICTVTINEGTALRLGLAFQGQAPRPGDDPYLVNSVEAVACRETGISASERATTMCAIGNPDAAAADLISPGHVMVQVARNILRDGSTAPELANALLSARALARFAAWADILDDDGELGGADWCRGLAARLGVPCFDGDAVRRFARAKLPAWDEVVRFSDAHFGRSPQIG